MSTKFSQSFKFNVVEKVINRDKEITLEAIAKEYGIAHSTVGRWQRELKQTVLGTQIGMTDQERRPQDWNMREKLQAIIDCDSLDDEAIHAYYRQKGIYTHHIKHWKQEVIEANTGTLRQEDKAQLKILKEENRQLKQELTRKEKALAETAALLVLKKKAQQSWESDEDNESWKRNVNNY